MMFTVIIIINTLVVVTLTFTVNRLITGSYNKYIFVLGILLYTVGYSLITASNSFLLLCIFAVIATLGELIYSPIQNAQRFLMIPNDQRSKYATHSMVSFFVLNVFILIGFILVD